MFDKIFKKPGLYLGQESITALHHFVNGIKFAERHNSISDKNSLLPSHLPEFEEWVENNFNPKRLTVNSFSLATVIDGNEKNAFYLWYQWYEKFLNHQNAL